MYQNKNLKQFHSWSTLDGDSALVVQEERFSLLARGSAAIDINIQCTALYRQRVTTFDRKKCIVLWSYGPIATSCAFWLLDGGKMTRS